MIRCGKCREFISASDKYCWDCGGKNVDFVGNEECPKCHKEVLKKTDIFCRNCGTNLKTGEKKETKKEEENLCPKCKSKFDKGDKFCENCGFKLK